MNRPDFFCAPLEINEALTVLIVMNLLKTAKYIVFKNVHILNAQSTKLHCGFQ